jgi:lipoyl(octanoyl) transferase
MSSITVCQLGLQAYEPVLAAMKSYTETRAGSSIDKKNTNSDPAEQDNLNKHDQNKDNADQLWLVEHLPVFTQGQAGKAEHLLTPGDIPVVLADRGGQVTYHGPGQIVIYVLVNLRQLSFNVRQLVCAIETSIRQMLAVYGIEGRTQDKAPGIYVGDAKIASLGLRIRKGNSYHGLALNVDLDLEPFQRINPCGYPGLKMTRIKDLLPTTQLPANELLAECLLGKLAINLGYDAWHYNSDYASLHTRQLRVS